MAKFFLTGATGHLGSAFVNFLESAGHDIQAMSRTGNSSRRWAGRVWSHTISHLHDFRSPIPKQILNLAEGTDYIVHIGGEVHGIRSLTDPETFVQGNVIGTFNMLEMARKIKPRAFLYVSTAEVYGPSEVVFLPDPHVVPHKETDPLFPTTPYAASKAAAEALVHSYYKSFNVPTITVRTGNLFGERQATDKFIPKILRKIIDGEAAEIHTSLTGADKRQWIHVDSFSEALFFLCGAGPYGGTYNVAGEQLTNLDLAQQVARCAGEPLAYTTKDSGDSPGHNLTYAISDEAIRKLGWKPFFTFEASLYRTVQWTLRNRTEWL